MDDDALRVGGAAEVVVDMQLCNGSGMCTTIVPALFDLDNDGGLILAATDVTEDMLEPLEDAVACCPTGAISINPNHAR